MAAAARKFDLGFPLLSSQFAAQTNSVGGATAHPVTRRIPQIGEKGWMVGGHPDTSGTRIPETPGSNPLTAHEAAAHIVKVALQTGGQPDGYAGSWINSEGKTALDASTRVYGRRSAERLGNDRNEDAIFGLEHANEVQLRVGRAKARKAKSG